MTRSELGSSRALFDTNILVYSLDARDAQKQRLAQDCIRTHAQMGTGMVSTQALHELFTVCVSKLGVKAIDARSIVQGFSDLQVIGLSESISFETMELAALHQLSIWDALMLAAAVASKCPTLYSEDMQPGLAIRGVRVVNPFAQTLP